MLQFKFKLTEEEYFDYNYYTAWASPGRKRYRFSYYTRVILLYGAVAGLYILGNDSHNYYIDIAIFAAIALIYFAMVPFLVKQSVRRRVRQVLEQPENRHILGETEVVLTDTGITDRDSESESRYQWDAVVRKSETASSYFLYTNSQHAIVIPKRVVISPKDRTELERLFDEHLPLSSDFSGA